MKYQILFSKKNKKNIISLLAVESAHSVVSVNSACLKERPCEILFKACLQLLRCIKGKCV